jgi:hypothetical protein
VVRSKASTANAVGAATARVRVVVLVAPSSSVTVRPTV